MTMTKGRECPVEAKGSVQAEHAGRAEHETRASRAAEVRAMAERLEAEGRLGLTRGFIQHGDVSVYAHVCSVACASLAVADTLTRIGIRTDRASLLRGALLHDYFLYDWHDPNNGHRLHGFSHPYTACRNAMKDFDLTARERVIIRRHMFPFVPVPPTCREAWIVCLADKWCALCETVAGRMSGGCGRLDGRAHANERPRAVRHNESSCASSQREHA